MRISDWSSTCALPILIGPSLAPVVQQVGSVPVANLGAKALLVHLAHRQHDVRVRLGLTVSADIPMHIEIGDHAALDNFAFDKLACQPNAFGLMQLARDGELNLAGKLRVLAHLGGFNTAPRSAERRTGKECVSTC